MRQVFKMPTPVKITGRSSTITNSFVNSIIPVICPSDEDIREALGVLGMAENDVRCAYCGDAHSEWDHLRPIVRNKRPTGFVSEIANLVPACGKCNQSKSGQEWRLWMCGTAPQSPKTRGVRDLATRCDRLEAFERWRTPTIVDWESIIETGVWEKHWANLERVHELLKECQAVAEGIRVTAALATIRQKELKPTG